MDMLHVVLLCLLVNARAAKEKRFLLNTLHGGQSGTRHLGMFFYLLIFKRTQIDDVYDDDDDCLSLFKR